MDNHILARVNCLQETMLTRGIDGFLIAQNVDLYYYTGSMQTGYLFVPVKGHPTFYVRRSVARAEQESACKVKPLLSFRGFGQQIIADYPSIADKGTFSMAAEFDVLPVQLYERLQRVLPFAEWIDGSTIIREQRMIKSQAEITFIREAGRLIGEAFEHALTFIREGMADVELMSELEHYIRRREHMGIMRMRGFNQEIVTGMVGSGWAAAMPSYFDGPAGGQGLGAASPQSSGHKVIRRNEPILVDIGCCVDGYVIDQTRTVVIGSLDNDLQSAYECSELILRQTESKLAPGTVSEELYMNAQQLANERGLAQHFMGYGADQVKFLGHGIGLEIDEWPVLAKGFTYPLESGMVIAIEPKFTFPERGVVGIENSYLITDDGYENLTPVRSGVVEI